MSKKDFELIAAVVRSADLSDHDRHALAVAFAAKLEDTNARFDWDRFIAACEETRS